MFGGMTSNESFLMRMRNNVTWGTMGIIVAIVLLFGISIYYYNYYIVSKASTSYKANSEHKTTESMDGNNKQAELLLFSTDWCPHCKTAKPEWESLKNELHGKTVNGYIVIFTDVNCTNETPEVTKMMNTYKIEGYPTIKLLKDGQVIEYDAKPTKKTLSEFLNTVL